uniref:Uncharacterized protein n=1 Tax=Lepeophtheirus salmonis TaxID=72036 RepID=A0A0K2VJN2_LEPSM
MESNAEGRPTNIAISRLMRLKTNKDTHL